MAGQRVLKGASASLSVQEHARNSGSDTAAYKGEFIDKSAVQRFLKAIPAITLTQAALACGSYPRALKYFEQHLRATHAYPYGGITRGYVFLSYSKGLLFVSRDMTQAPQTT